MRSDGTVWAWGNNFYNDLGPQVQDVYDNCDVPVQVTGLSGVTQIAAGGAPAAIAAGTYSAMMVGTDGSVWGWGQDLFSNLGVGSGNGILYTPTQTLNPGSGIIQLAAGYDYVLGLRSDGTVVAWGDNSNGQLGDGTTTTTTRVTPVQVSGLSGVSQVSADFDYSLAVHTTKVISR